MDKIIGGFIALLLIGGAVQSCSDHSSSSHAIYHGNVHFGGGLPYYGDRDPYEGQPFTAPVEAPEGQDRQEVEARLRTATDQAGAVGCMVDGNCN